MVCELVMKKTIIVTIVILCILTAIMAAAFTVISDDKKGETTGASEHIQNEEILQNDAEKNVENEVDITKKEGVKEDAELVEKVEINRTRYEDCGYGTAYYLIEYSDGTSEIVDE